MLLEHSTLAPLSGLLAEELERGDDGAEAEKGNNNKKKSDAPEGEEGGGGFVRSPLVHSPYKVISLIRAAKLRWYSSTTRAAPSHSHIFWYNRLGSHKKCVQLKKLSVLHLLSNIPQWCGRTSQVIRKMLPYHVLPYLPTYTQHVRVAHWWWEMVVGDGTLLSRANKGT